MNKNDRNVSEYLDRARTMVIGIAMKYKKKDTEQDYDRAIFEIAKMIQNEEIYQANLELTEQAIDRMN